MMSYANFSPSKHFVGPKPYPYHSKYLPKTFFFKFSTQK